MALLPGETRTSDTVEDKYGRPEVVLVDANSLPSNEFPDASGPRDSDGRRILAVSGGVPGGGGGGGDVTQEEFDALDSRVDVLEATSSNQVLGVNTIGVTPVNLNGNHANAQRFTAPAGGTLTGFQAYLDGNGPGAGAQRVRMIVFTDDGTNPVTTVGSSAPYTITSGDAAAWQTFAGTVVLPGAGSYFMALAVEVGGLSTNLVGRTFSTTAPAGSQIYNTDSSLVGTVAATFGTPSGSVAALYSLRATYTTSPGIQGLTIQDEGAQQGASASAQTLNFVGDTVSVSNSAGVATVTVSAAAATTGSSAVTSMLYTVPLPASSVFQSDPIPMAGKNLTAAHVGSNNASTTIYDSADGVTTRTRNAVAISPYGGVSAPIMAAYGHVRYTNSTTDQTFFEGSLTIA